MGPFRVRQYGSPDEPSRRTLAKTGCGLLARQQRVELLPQIRIARGSPRYESTSLRIRIFQRFQEQRFDAGPPFKLAGARLGPRTAAVAGSAGLLHRWHAESSIRPGVRDSNPAILPRRGK